MLASGAPKVPLHARHSAKRDAARNPGFISSSHKPKVDPAGLVYTRQNATHHVALPPRIQMILKLSQDSPASRECPFTIAGIAKGRILRGLKFWMGTAMGGE